MRIFKFGGASVKDAWGIKNVSTIIKNEGIKDILIVVSAMGKTTNALEQVIHDYFKDTENLNHSISVVKDYHLQIINDLFEDKNHKIHDRVTEIFSEMNTYLEGNKSPDYNYVYDQVVSYGEILSSVILSEYLNSIGIDNNWLDVRNCIKTDNTYRDAVVNWEVTELQIKSNVISNTLNITQGFLGADNHNFTTTLGREGSDYSAAIFAYCLNASEVTIWKDVAGVLNADPRYFENTTLLNQISYKEAIELSFYGATVIHPKTLQPLRQKEIPLYVRSFLNPTHKGTAISKGAALEPKMPCFIVMKNQHLISISSKDFSFIMEEHISEIFSLLHQFKTKVHLIQNSAISFSVCIDDKFNNINLLLEKLSERFSVASNKNVSLYTIRHFNTDAIELVENGKEVLLKQVTQKTIQLVCK